jgi:ABC-type multidrug transport system fused ATPase/permease subunit
MDDKSTLEKKRRETLEGFINNRLYELKEIQDFAAKRATRLGNYSLYSNVVVIILGALVAARETFSGAIGSSSAIIIAFALAGVAIAVLTSLQTTFNWGTNSGMLASLAAACRYARQQYQTELDRIAFESNTAHAISALDKLHDRMLDYLNGVRGQAVQLGLNPVDTAASTPAR